MLCELLKGERSTQLVAKGPLERGQILIQDTLTIAKFCPLLTVPRDQHHLQPTPLHRGNQQPIVLMIFIDSNGTHCISIWPLFLWTNACTGHPPAGKDHKRTRASLHLHTNKHTSTRETKMYVHAPPRSYLKWLSTNTLFS